jgi:hypothetical protein
MSTERQLQDELARLDASITVLARVQALGEQGQRDLEALRVRRAEVSSALRALRATREH